MFSVVSVCLSVRLSVRPSVCLSVCPSVCLSVQTITFEPLHIGTSFLVWRYILTISRSSLSIKVIGLRSRSCAKNDYLLISTCYSFVCTFKAIKRSRSCIKVKVTHQGQGQIKVNIKLRSFLRRDTLTRVVCIWIKCVLVTYTSVLLPRDSTGGTCFGVMNLSFQNINQVKMKNLHIYQIKATMIYRKQHFLSKHLIMLSAFLFDIFSMNIFIFWPN